jgi:hypothetical protein
LERCPRDICSRLKEGVGAPKSMDKSEFNIPENINIFKESQKIIYALWMI